MLLLSLLDIVATRLSFPMPILAALVGVMGGGLAMAFDANGMNFFLDSYDLWFLNALALTPQSVVVIFLPPLLFEVTLGVDVRKLRQDTVIVAMMAVVAVIVATATVGLALSYTAQLPLLACLLLGATISTTDPAAVVAIFRRIGAPRRLLIVLEGESLLNDAAAIALFVLFIQMLRSGTVTTPAEIASDFAYLFLLGGLTGFFLGRLASRLMTLMRGSFLAQASLLFATVYATYLTAELFLHASGVVAVVVAGLTVTVSGASRVTSEDWNAVRLVWTQLGYWANGLIILIAAALSPVLLLELEWVDLGLIGITMLATLAARGLVLFGLLPALDILGLSPPMTQPQKLLIWWGGVRGAVTLLLALSLAASTALPDGLGTKLAAIGIGYVFVTLFLNGGTLALVTKALGLDRLSNNDQALRAELINRTIKGGIDHLDELAGEHALDAEDIAPLRQEMQARLAKLEAIDHGQSPAFGDLLRTGLVVLANQERRLVRQHYDGGTIGRETLRNLQRVAESLADAAVIKGRDGYERQARRSAGYPSVFRFAVALQRYLGIDWLLSRLLARRFRLLFEWEIVLKDLLRFVEWRVENLLGEAVADNLRELIEERRASVRDGLLNLELQYPIYAQTLRQGFVARAALRWEAGRYNRFLREAIIGPDLHRTLARDLDTRLQATYRTPDLDARFQKAALIDTVPMFQELTTADRKRLARIVRTRTALPGDLIVRRGERGDAMYFIASGAVEMSTGDKVSRLGTGEFFGELALLRPQRRRSSDVTAVGFCRLLVLQRDDFKQLSAKVPSLSAAIKQAASIRPTKAIINAL